MYESLFPLESVLRDGHNSRILVSVVLSKMLPFSGLHACMIPGSTLALLAMESFRHFETAVLLSAQLLTLTGRRQTSLWPMISNVVYNIPRHGRHVADALGTPSRESLPCSRISQGSQKVRSKRIDGESVFSVVGSPSGPKWLIPYVVWGAEAQRWTTIPPCPISTMPLGERNQLGIAW